MANVVVFGATSAVAAAVVARYAARGDRLHLVGRSTSKLHALCASIGGSPGSATVDFVQPGAPVRAVTDAIGALGSIDIALIAHGYLGDQLRSEQDPAEAELILRTNYLSVVELLIPLCNHMEGRRAGRIGVITSVAGERGRPRNYTYGSAKGALNLYLQGVRSRLYAAGVAVTTIKLGPVDTPMTNDHPKNALFTTPEKIAGTIVSAIDDGEAETFVPRYWRAIMGVVRNTPEVLFQRMKSLSGR